MKTFSLSKAKNNFIDLINMSQHEPVIIESQGGDAAVILSYQEYQRMYNPDVEAFQKLCDEIGAEAEANGLTEEKLAEILAEEDG